MPTSVFHNPARPAFFKPVLAFVVVAAVLASVVFRQSSPRQAAPTNPDVVSSGPLHEVVIRKPTQPVVFTGASTPDGRLITAPCSTCHLSRPANSAVRLGASLGLFHQGLKGTHGDLACVACHDPASGYQSLRLADGRSIPYAEVMQLCAQCHGPQYRDYQSGAHGGMTGYWDLSKGPRFRNNCIHCHDPHAPRYPTVQPAQRPLDLGGPVKIKDSSHE